MMGFEKFLGILSRMKSNEGIRPSVAESYLAKVKPEESFQAVHGEEFTSLVGMFVALQNMEDHVFDSHVNEEKNDFANWVEHCIQDEELAQRLRGKTDKEEMTVAVGERVKELLHALK